MHRYLTAILFVILTATVTAQEQWARLEADPALPFLIDVSEASPPLGPTLASTAQQPTRPARPPGRAAGPRRRGSMVGYIDDAIVESKVRIRVDAAFHTTAPDRAEFFYAKCGCYQDLPSTDPAYDGAAPGPRPGAANDLDFRQLNVSGEYAFSGRVSVFGQLPVRWLQPQSFIPGTGAGFPNQSGIGDVRGGVKLALVATADRNLTAQAQVYAPTGDASKGLGTDHASFEPALLYYQRVSDVVTLESQLGIWLPSGGSAGVPTGVDENFSGQVLSYGIGSGFELYREGRVLFAPVVELVGWRVLSGFQTGPTPQADGTNIVNLKVGARLSVDDLHSVYVGYGRALTDAIWYDDIVRLEYRYSFR